MAKSNGFNWGAVAGEAAGVGLGLGLQALDINGNRNRRNQLKQQQALTDIQGEANKRQADYESQLSYDMWKKTASIKAQKEQMLEEGLSIAGMYSGVGGGGGAGGVSVAGVGAGTASDEASLKQSQTANATQMAQLGLLTAQKENIEADTENKKAGAGKAVAETVGQGIANEVGEATKYDQMNKIEEESRAAMGRANKELAEGVVSQETANARIKQIRAEAVGATIENNLKQSNIQLNKAKIQEIANEIANKYQTEMRGQDINTENNKRIVDAIIKSAWINAGANVTRDVISILTKTAPKGSTTTKMDKDGNMSQSWTTPNQ